MPNFPTSASPLSRMLFAMRVKSPFSHNALFAFIASSPFLMSESVRSGSYCPICSRKAGLVWPTSIRCPSGSRR